MPDCSSIADEGGAHVRARTGDLFLTKEVLCLLSYVGPRRRRHPWSAGVRSVAGSADPRQPSVNLGKSMPSTEVRRPATMISSDGKPLHREDGGQGGNRTPTVERRLIYSQ